MKARMRLFTATVFIVIISAVLLYTQNTFAQEKEVSATPAASPADVPQAVLPGMPAGHGINMPLMPRVNPAVLMRMRDQMTFELQQTQRQLNFIDPNDAQLRDSFTDRQNELIKQIKDIDGQLKAAGGLPEVLNNPADNHTAVNVPAEKNRLLNQFPNTLPANVPPNLPRQFDPAMFPGGNPAIPPSVPVQQSGLPPQQILPTEFDQEQAFANSPWVPQPSKELTELKKSVEALRKETDELKTVIKALEAQIQLLNRNILLSQPAASK